MTASFYEFMSVWLAGGEACLNLTTIRGMAKVRFNCTFGFPGAPIPSFPHLLPHHLLLFTSLATEAQLRERGIVIAPLVTRQLKSWLLDQGQLYHLLL